MKKLFLLSLSVVIMSCNNSSKLEEVVEIPAPESTEAMAEIGNPEDVQVDEGGAFKMLGLPYAYNALEPHIDARTMEIHYSRHHLAYANNLNKAVEGTEFASYPIEELLKKLDSENKALRNNGGGYYNHNLFWEILSAEKSSPSEELANAINRDFGSFDNFKSQISDAAMKQFGSGWAWLVAGKDGKLSVISTANQDNPLMAKLGYSGTPVLGIDVWEHAYYLNYQNKRKDYLDAVFNIINWDKVSKKYAAAISQN